ncbi:MAG: TatD family deoxyribonuclease [Gammaproteobacteria bacterium]|nr:MAG: TatD family deoxyribonuclease [Gammaproteobacteria bacterium]
MCSSARHGSTEGWIDSHCHLDAFLTDGSLDEVIRAARLAGVVRWIVPGVEPKTWAGVMEVCRRVAGAGFALGVHPWYAHCYPDVDASRLKNAIGQALDGGLPVVAVGEAGLDRLRGAMAAQIEWLRVQVECANEFGLPLILHCVRRHGQLLEFLTRYRPACGFVVHGFSGAPELAGQYIRLGGYLGLGRALCRPDWPHWPAFFEQVPLERILVETDAPDMKASDWPGERNVPSNLVRVVQALRERLDDVGIRYPDVQAMLSENTFRLFAGLPASTV